jgi:hypothetical protein
MTVWLESIYATRTPAAGLLSLVILALAGCSLPDRPPLETPRDWCKDIGKECER